MAPGMREFRAWQEAVATAGEVARAARKVSRGETRPLTDLLVRCSAELALAIARAHAKSELVAQRDAFQASREAAAGLETALAIARHAELLPVVTCADLSARAASTSRLVSGYLVYLERQISAESPELTEPRTVS
jgi:four helix bundle protein